MSKSEIRDELYRKLLLEFLSGVDLDRDGYMVASMPRECIKYDKDSGKFDVIGKLVPMDEKGSNSKGCEGVYYVEDKDARKCLNNEKDTDKSAVSKPIIYSESARKNAEKSKMNVLTGIFGTYTFILDIINAKYKLGDNAKAIRDEIKRLVQNISENGLEKTPDEANKELQKHKELNKGMSPETELEEAYPIHLTDYSSYEVMNTIKLIKITMGIYKGLVQIVADLNPTIFSISDYVDRLSRELEFCEDVEGADIEGMITDLDKISNQLECIKASNDNLECAIELMKSIDYNLDKYDGIKMINDFNENIVHNCDKGTEEVLEHIDERLRELDEIRIGDDGLDKGREGLYTFLTSFKARIEEQKKQKSRSKNSDIPLDDKGIIAANKPSVTTPSYFHTTPTVPIDDKVVERELRGIRDKIAQETEKLTVKYKGNTIESLDKILNKKGNVYPCAGDLAEYVLRDYFPETYDKRVKIDKKHRKKLNEICEMYMSFLHKTYDDLFKKVSKEDVNIAVRICEKNERIKHIYKSVAWKEAFIESGAFRHLAQLDYDLESLVKTHRNGGEIIIDTPLEEYEAEKTRLMKAIKLAYVRVAQEEEDKINTSLKYLFPKAYSDKQ